MPLEGNNVVRGLLEAILPGIKLKCEPDSIKIHVDELDSEQIIGLASLVKFTNIKVTLKRGGTGITIIARTSKQIVVATSIAAEESQVIPVTGHAS